jgi:hypothetical protein
MWFRKKRLYEMAPESLDLEALSLLQCSLLAKLLQVTKDLQLRFDVLATEGNPIDSKGAAFFATEAKRMNGILLILDNVLAQQIGKGKAATEMNDPAHNF